MHRFSMTAKRLSGLLGLGVLVLALAGPLWGQCVMCRESAKYQRAEAIESLNRGIIILAVPPAAIMLGIGWVTYRARDEFLPEEDSRLASDEEPDSEAR